MATRTKPLPLKTLLGASALAAGFALAPLAGGVAHAQSAQPNGGATAGAAMKGASQSAHVPQQELTKAGHALKDVLQINHEYGAKLSQAKSKQQKHKIVTMARSKAKQAIKSDGLTVGQYNQVLAQARQNPKVREKLLAAAGIHGNGK